MNYTTAVTVINLTNKYMTQMLNGEVSKDRWSRNDCLNRYNRIQSLVDKVFQQYTPDDFLPLGREIYWNAVLIAPSHLSLWFAKKEKEERDYRFNQRMRAYRVQGY